MAEIYSRIEPIRVEGEFKPCIVVRRKYDKAENYYAIPREECWRFSPEHNPEYVRFFVRVCDEAYAALEYSDVVLSRERQLRRMLELENAITRWFDEIKDVTPPEKGDLKHVPIAEVRGKYGDFTLDAEIEVPYALRD